MVRLYCVKKNLFSIKRIYLYVNISAIELFSFVCLSKETEYISGRNDSRNWISVSEH